MLPPEASSGRKPKPAFDVSSFLSTTGANRHIVHRRRREALFAQGKDADCVYYLHTGHVKLTVSSQTGKEATVGILGPGDFVGQECLSENHTIRSSAAIPVSDCIALRIEKSEFLRALHEQPSLARLFVRFLLKRSAMLEQELANQLLNSTEKRLARALLQLGGQRPNSNGESVVIPRISQESLATMIGTTRSRVNFFMTQFRKKGFIEYDHEVRFNPSLLATILDQ